MASLSISRKATVALLLAVVSLLLSGASAQLSYSQSKSLLRLPRLLEYPPAIAGWSNATAFCYLPPSPFVTVTCSGNRVTELIIVGGAPRAAPLSANFSSDSLFTTLSRLPSLTTLSLVSLGLWGPLPGKVDRFDGLRVLNLSSNHFSGRIPPEISTMSTLQNLVLSRNSFNGSVPDLKSLKSLAELDLAGNHLGPGFPSLGASLTTLVLKNNSFQGAIPAEIAPFNLLQKLDLSYNNLSGRIPAFLFGLKSIQYLSLSNNKLTGEVPAGASCSGGLGYVDISSNLLVGKLPWCISSNSSSRVVLASGNCLSSGNPKLQHTNSYCNAAALAAVLPPANKISGSKSNLGLIAGIIIGGVVAAIVLAGSVAFLLLRRARAEDVEGHVLPKPNAGVSSMELAPRKPADAKPQAVRIETFGLTPYRVFTLEELEEATNSFEQANLIENGPQGQFYKGWLEDGSMVIIRCLKLKQKFSHQNLLQYMDIIAKLRHRHLVSILGHCINIIQDGANATASSTTVFLVSEYVTNGTLRSHLTEWRKREMLKWPQRVSAVIGVARGVQFLHTVSVPGIAGNDLNIENVLLDKTLTAKISSYNLPMLPRTKNNKQVGSESPFFGFEDGDLISMDKGEKEDIYQVGLILLEVITGKPAGSKTVVDSLRKQLQKCLMDNTANLKEIADATIRGTFALDSLSTAVELALNCVAEDPNMRPPIDDVLWNLQYSVQIQDGWASSENLIIQT